MTAPSTNDILARLGFRTRPAATFNPTGGRRDVIDHDGVVVFTGDVFEVNDWLRRLGLWPDCDDGEDWTVPEPHLPPGTHPDAEDLP